jgi:hypothetical protein
MKISGLRISVNHDPVLLDTCESGALIAGHARSRTDAPASEAAVGRLHEATGRPVITAAATGQFAHEGEIGASGEKHGLFTCRARCFAQGRQQRQRPNRTV